MTNFGRQLGHIIKLTPTKLGTKRSSSSRRSPQSNPIQSGRAVKSSATTAAAAAAPLTACHSRAQQCSLAKATATASALAESNPIELDCEPWPALSYESSSWNRTVYQLPRPEMHLSSAAATSFIPSFLLSFFSSFKHQLKSEPAAIWLPVCRINWALRLRFRFLCPIICSRVRSSVRSLGRHSASGVFI